MIFAETIKKRREFLRIPQRDIAGTLNIDIPMYSRIERGERPAKRGQVIVIAKLLGIEEKELVNLWLAEKVLCIVGDEEDANKILSIVSNSIK